MFSRTANKTTRIEIDTAVNEPLWNVSLASLEPKMHQVIHKTLEIVGFKPQNAELSLLLTNNSFIQTLNRDYRGKDKATNVLSFPQCEPENLCTDAEFLALGDIVLALETIKTEATEQNKDFEDHVMHLVIHGLLHLLGHDHEEESEAETMENLEIRILENFGIKNPYESDLFMR
ncbi:MAG: rRNA maturation RNase YbeY [Alphaproteobacteria bacterium]|nr:rRNA maturation RNase YbeY [Alphaproteobacteria bacterium]